MVWNLPELVWPSMRWPAAVTSWTLPSSTSSMKSLKLSVSVWSPLFALTAFQRSTAVQSITIQKTAVLTVEFTLSDPLLRSPRY